MKYVSYIVEVPDVASSLQEISRAGGTIVSSLYISDGQQVLLIVEEKPKPLEPLKPKEELSEFEEGSDEEEEE